MIRVGFGTSIVAGYLALLATPALAQETATSFDELIRLGKLAPGKQVRIVYTPEGEALPREITIDLVELTRAAVMVGSDDAPVSIPASEVESIHTLKTDPLGNGTLIGALVLGGIGAAFIGVPVCVSDLGDCAAALWYAVAQPAAVGAGIGLAVDALNREQIEVVAFQRVGETRSAAGEIRPRRGGERSTRRFSLQPLIGRDRNGMLFSVVF